MNSLTKVLLEDLLDADNKKVTAIYGGGFKPPTKGHFDVVAKASEQNPEIDDILIYVGDGERDGISQGESIQIWELYKKYLPIKTIIEPVNAPIGSILRYAKDHPKEKILWIIGAREDNPQDFADISTRTRTLEKYPNLHLRVIQTSGGVSGTAARNAVKDNNKDQFFHLIPDIPEKEQVWDIISPIVKETLNEYNNTGPSTPKVYIVKSDGTYKEVPIGILSKIPNLTYDMGGGETNYYPEKNIVIVDNIPIEEFVKDPGEIKDEKIYVEYNLNQPYSFPKANKIIASQLVYSDIMSKEDKIFLEYLSSEFKFGIPSTLSKYKNTPIKITTNKYIPPTEYYIYEVTDDVGNISKISTTKKGSWWKYVKVEGNLNFKPIEGLNPEHYNQLGLEPNKALKKQLEQFSDILGYNIIKIKKLNENLKESFELQEEITEVGEANLSPYKWEEVNKNSWVTFIEFTTESETKYKVNLTNVEIVDPEGGDINIKAIDIEFFAKPKGAEDSSSKIVVNKGEIYRVMSTLTSIIKHYIKEIEAQAIIYSPSKKSDEEDFGTQRDNLYKAFISKAIPGAKFTNSKNNIIAILPNTVNEIVTDTEVICDNCDWEWKIVDGGNDLYICHKCGHDNNPDLQESKNISKTILKDGETIYLELKYSMQERDYTSLSVIAYDSNNNKIGAAYFNSDETDKKMVISAADTSIKDTWRRKGVASSIYDLIKKQGYKIVPSKSQSDDGLKFTDKYFKQNEINPSTKLKSNIINEGRYDSISRQLASYTLKGWKDDFEHNEPTGRVEFTVGPDGDLEYEDLKFSYKGVAIFAGIQTYSYNGSARLTSGEIKITYSIPKSMLPQGWEKIYMDLISVIRHEIEHLTQGGVNVKPGKEILDLPLRRLVIKYPDTLRYILLPSEKDANVQGLYLKAKKSRRPYAEVVDEYIRDVLKITNKNDVDILKGMYDKRAKELNLPAILENDPFGLNKLSRQFIKEALIETWNPKESFVSLSKYMIDNGMNIKPLPKIKIISNDEENASNLLGKTAYYNPNDKSITLYTKDRHPKDICRSFTHEMVHHEQNLEGRLNNINTTNTNEDGALPEIEREAYEKGNMMLRNWEDSIKNV
jgi:hypothetical protein